MYHRRVNRHARRRAEAKLGLIVHLIVYVAVNEFLAFLNLTTSPGYYWCLWPLFGWGIGVFFHILGVFVFPSVPRFKEQMIASEAEKIAAGRP